MVLDFLVVVQKSWLAFYRKEDIHLVTVNFDIVSVGQRNYSCLFISLIVSGRYPENPAI